MPKRKDIARGHAFCISIARACRADLYLPIWRALLSSTISQMHSRWHSAQPVLNDDESRSCASTVKSAKHADSHPVSARRGRDVLAHQEFLTLGYPGTKGRTILSVRIFTIADSLDAMISDRPYRRALPMSHARRDKRCSGVSLTSGRDVFMTFRNSMVDLREHLGFRSAWRI